METNKLSPAARLILTTTLEDPERWDLADALQASDSEVVTLSQATPQDIDQVLAIIRIKFEKGIADAKAMLED